VEHRNLPNVLLALMLLKGYARLWCKRRAQRRISGMINKVKAFCWYLILLFYLFTVLKSDLISVCRGIKVQVNSAVLTKGALLLSQRGDLTELKCKEMIMPESSDGSLSTGEPNLIIRKFTLALF
jgi:hypothetical protein